MDTMYTPPTTKLTDTFAHHYFDKSDGCSVIVSRPVGSWTNLTVRLSYKWSGFTYVNKNGCWLREDTVPDGNSWKLRLSKVEEFQADRLTAMVEHCKSHVG